MRPPMVAAAFGRRRLDRRAWSGLVPQVQRQMGISTRRRKRRRPRRPTVLGRRLIGPRSARAVRLPQVPGNVVFQDALTRWDTVLYERSRTERLIVTTLYW